MTTEQIELEKYINEHYQELDDNRKSQLFDDICRYNNENEKKSYKTLISEAFSAFENAEQKLNLVHDKFGELFVPPINELRYAGYHLAKGQKLRVENSKLANKEIIKARTHADRSYYDCLDLELFHLKKEINSFFEKFIGHGNDLSLLLTIDEINKVKEEYRKILDKIDTDKQQYYSDRKAYYPKLLEHIKGLDALVKNCNGRLYIIANYLEKKSKIQWKIDTRDIIIGCVSSAIVTTLFLVF